MRRAVLGVLPLLAACGPIRSTSLIVDAQAELAAARAAKAESLAPFEYTAADQYLHKAREEQSYSDFEISVDYAQKSLDCARVARWRAESATRDALGSTRPTQATRQRCLPGPERGLVPADEEPAAGGGKAKASAPPAKKQDPREPDDPPPAADPPPQNGLEEPVEPPPGDLPEGDLPDGDGGGEAEQ